MAFEALGHGLVNTSSFLLEGSMALYSFPILQLATPCINSNIFNIIVLPTNDPPRLISYNDDEIPNYRININITDDQLYLSSINATDIDGDIIEYSHNCILSNFSLDKYSGELSFICSWKEEGSYNFSIFINDGNGSVIHLNFTLNVVATDLDKDGFPDKIDIFPFDPTEWNDTDSDGIGDNTDLFPNDSTEWNDTDSDSIGDNTDLFPNDSTEWNDTDSDGIGDNTDLFPNDSTEWNDTDSDGIGDNSDNYPFDSSKWEEEEKSSKMEKPIFIIIIIGIFALLIIIIGIFIIILKRQKERNIVATFKTEKPMDEIDQILKCEETLQEYPRYQEEPIEPERNDFQTQYEKKGIVNENLPFQQPASVVNIQITTVESSTYKEE